MHGPALQAGADASAVNACCAKPADLAEEEEVLALFE
jgi:hypothetical protein